MIDRFNLNVELTKKNTIIVTSHTFEHRFFIDHFFFLIRRWKKRSYLKFLVDLFLI